MASAVDKSVKYDRQLRLWAKDGQSRLEQSHICLINANATGAEVLKNLVLPGIGAFTIIDDTIVQPDDLSGNFFLSDDDVGQSASASLCKNLMELNPDASGHFISESLPALLAQPDLWTQYTIVVVSGFVKSSYLQKLSELLWDANIPLLCVSIVGFYGALRVMAKQTAIIETHDPSKTFDLRIDCPWKELKQYAASFVMEDLDDTDHAHVPYIVIFIKALDKWREDHEGNPPTSYTEKRHFRSHYVEQMSRDISIETNFIEAAQSVHRALQRTTIPQSTQRLFERSEVSSDNSETDFFWFLVKALKRFVDKHGKLPLPGNLPDMASTTSNYIQLQQIYSAKAQNDQTAFTAELQDVLSEAGRDISEIRPDVVSVFCKNSAFLYVAEGSPLGPSESLKQQLPKESRSVSPEAVDLCIYFGILALHHWTEFMTDTGIESYIECFSELSSIPNSDLTTPIREILSEIFLHRVDNYHNICSLMGGIVGQEVLKITTAQYIPLDDLFIFNGITSTSSKWKN